MADKQILAMDADGTWVLAYDDLQWVVQKRQRQPTRKSSGFEAVTFPGRVSTIWRTVRERHITVTATASATLTAWSASHREWLTGLQNGVDVSASAAWS